MFLEIYNAPPDSEVEKELRGDIDDRADVDKLVKRAQSGDDEAFSSLVEIFEKFVYNTALRYLSAAAQPTEAADDIAQNTFIKAWRSLSSFRGSAFFRHGCSALAANSARDYIRHKNLSPDRVADIIRRRRR